MEKVDMTYTLASTIVTRRAVNVDNNKVWMSSSLDTAITGQQHAGKRQAEGPDSQK